MEKFAIDLDKVLDDFEFNEDCAEQIASVTPSTINASSSISKSGLEPSTLKTYNYVIEPGKASKEFETIPPPEKHKESQLVNTESRCSNEGDPTTDNLNYNKGESTAEDTDSINHFFTHEHTNDSKLTQKQTVLPYDLEQASLTIYNDISQKLLQKQQNGSSSPKIDNRYDNRLNQPNIKPSVSNVFSSLNEYINAPPGSLDYIHSASERHGMEHNINSNTIQERNDESTYNAVSTYFQTVEPITKNTDIGTEQGGTIITADTVRETSILDYQDSIVPVMIESFTMHDSDIEQNSTRDIAITSEKAEDLEVIGDNVIGNAKHPGEMTCNYEEASIHTSKPTYQPVGESSNKLEVINTKIYNSHNFERTFDDVDGDEQEMALQPGHGNSEYECTYIQSQENMVVTTVESDCTASIPVTEIFPVENTVTEKEGSSNLNDKFVRASGTARKPVGFSNIGPSSEEELTRYLAEIEEERLKGKNNIYQVTLPSKVHETAPENTVQSMLHNQIDEDIDEAPIFENVIIGELPKISEAELQEKAKKFPIIDYSKEKSDEDALSDPFEKHIIKEHNDHAKSALMEQECQLKDEKCRDMGETINDPSDNAQSRKYAIPVQSTSNDLKYVDNFSVSERKDILDEKSNQDSQEYVYNIYTDQGSSSNTKTDVHLEENIEDVLDSTNCSSSCKLETESNINCHYKESKADETRMLDDNAKYSSDATLEPVEVPTSSNINESSDESDKPTRPQTLDIVLPDNTDEHETLGSTNDTPSGQAQSSVDGAKDECHESSPDVLDNSSIEPISILGKQPPFWVPDSEAPSCMLCDVKFTVLKRRHHCRACGKVLCNKCCNMKYKLEYQGNIDSRVCVSCYELLTKAEADQGMLDWSSSYSSYMSSNDINSPQGRQPNPNNPMEYCSTIPPLQQLAGGLPPPPTVMVPVGVLKREGGTKTRPEGSKSVMFSDGIRPGCDLTELDMSWDLKPPYRKPGNKRIPTPGSSLPSTTAKRQNLPRLDPNTESYVPQDPNAYPPTVSIHKGQVSYQTVTDEGLLYKTLKNECEPPVMFAINRNLYAYVKITNLNCCVNKICWNVTSRGLACVGQDEVILLVETLPDETRIPKDLLIFINQLFIEAIKGNTVSELGFSIYHGGNLLSSREHAGFLFIRQTLQCLQKIVLPPAPFLVGLLVHRWETPWAKVFPLRLLLRLGAEYRYYPCPLVSVRFRDALYFEIGHTVMKVLADFRNFGYTLPGVRGLTIHLRNRMTDVMFPRNRYDQVIKGLNNSNDHVLAYASNFSISADSHLVCIQTNTGGESSYQTQAINIHNKPRTVTGASFIVINGALKSSACLSAKSSIVEDGLMVEIMPEKMEALKAALKNMQDFSIGCGRQGAPEPDETVNIKWVDNDVQFNLGVKSPIDAQLMDGIPSIRVHNGTDYKGTSRFIRWTEVFIIKSDDHPTGVHDPVDINKLSGNIAKATCTALVKLLDLLATAGLTKLGVRTTIHPDNVGYEAGSEGTKLPPIYMNSLDNELIQVLHKAAQCSQDAHTVLELIFYVLDD